MSVLVPDTDHNDKQAALTSLCKVRGGRLGVQAPTRPTVCITLEE